MYIKSLYIESFAAMKEREFSFSEGLNIIEGSNESGKSTLCMFIKFMFYGLSGRTSDGEMSERQKYVPWDTGTAAGTLTVVTAKGEYRISRTLSVFDGEAPKERLFVIDLESGEKVFKGKVPGVEILGIDEQMFVNTVFVRQIGSTAIDGTGMTEAIENILLSGDENVSLKKALDRLDKARKTLMHKRGAGGALQQAMQDRARLEKELSESRQGNADMIELEGESDRLSSLIAARTREKEENAALCDAYAKIVAGRRVDAALEQQKKINGLSSELSDLEGYGNISEKSGRINALSARLSGIESRLKGLRRTLGDEPDTSDRMTDEEILSSKNEASLAKKLKAKKNTLFAFGLVTALLGIVLLVGAFLLSDFDFYMLAAPGAVLLLAAVICIVLCTVNARKYKNILGKWNARDIPSLEKEIEERILRAHIYSKTEDERNKKNIEIYECEEERKKVLSSLRTAAFEFSSEEIPDTDILVSKALERASEIADRRETLNRELGTLRGEMRAYSDVLSSDGGQAVKDAAKKALETEAGKKALDFTSKAAESAKSKKNFAESVLPGLLKRKGEVDSLLARLRATTKDLSILSSQLDTVNREIETMQKRLAGIEEATSALQASGEGLRSSLVPKALSEAGELMKNFTDGKYDELSVSGDFSVSFRIGGVKREIAYMSSGTADAAYISLRASLAKVLFSGDALPLIYDESFARIDEKRLSEILSMLSDGGMQSLVFTCRSLEGEIAKELCESCKITL